jgi:poly-gamma-glutamate synthesis protein (capsule biosynthesis protein)
MGDRVDVFLRHFVIAAAVVLNAGAGWAQTVVTPKPQPARSFSGETITITLAGDTGYSPNQAPVRPNGVARHGEFQTWQDTTSKIKSVIDGDLNFLNVETVVTDSNGLRPDLKGQRGPFNFRTHPNGLQHLVGLGFNVLSLANNHSMDYGVDGLRDTLRHVEKLRGGGLLAAAGIGLDRDAASRPEMIYLKGARIAFSAIGIVTNNLARHRAGAGRPGQIAYRFDDDFDLSIGRLADAKVDFRILSIHYGLEGRVRTDERQIRDFRRKAALGKGLDLIVGHHAHVVRGVEVAGRSVIFYGLGNFLHHGTANMSGKGICKDYGLVAKVHIARDSAGQWIAQAIEAIPVTGMHNRVAPMVDGEAAKRVHVLNYLAGTLGEVGGKAQGVRFTPQRDGRGLYCFSGADQVGGKIAELCRGWRAAGAIPANLRGRIAGACAR